MMSIGRALARHAAQDPHRPSVTDATGTITRCEFDRRSNALARLPGGGGGGAEATVSEAELLSHVGQVLVRYKVPRSIELVREPVRDDAGKVRRSALRAARLGATSSPPLS